ncbi:TIGR04076 family protein [Humibacillus sp. DSM 29435]|uniref:TIGR04076 family protein n=1 Tax=Humibacillus sp. DSM 29435 TaxID=1869167 RepID=UPI000872E6B2|nr:TIGR04076 family protein [Humibacillus sp. DSM 29435]OFE16007.1 TIGR04076 family protein [Humibacillus sp. DSM 29435]
MSDRPETDDVTVLADLRVVVDRIEGRSVCGLRVGDEFTVTSSSQLRMPPGGHFCLYALAAVLPLLPAKQRALSAGDWLSSDCEAACPDPDERLVMRIESGPVRRHATEDLT